MRREPAIELGGEPRVGANFGKIVGADTEQARGLLGHGELVLAADGDERLGKNERTGADDATVARVAYDAVEHDVGGVAVLALTEEDLAGGDASPRRALLHELELGGRATREERHVTQ